MSVCMCVSLVAESCPTLCHSHIYIFICTYICCMHTLSHEKCLICMLTRSSHVHLFVTSWTVSCQAPLSMIFFWQEYWSGLPCPLPGDLPNPGIKLASLASHVWQQILYCWATWEAPIHTAFNFLQQIILHFCFSLYPECSFSALSLH